MIQRVTTSEILIGDSVIDEIATRTGQDAANIEWVVASDCAFLEQTVAEVREFMLNLLVHADQPPSEECKTKARAFVKAFDERVKNGPKNP